MSLLSVEDLHVHFVTDDALGLPRVARALNGVSLHVEPGEIVGLVGETGAGKSLTAQAVMGLLQPPAQQVGGRILFQGRDLSALSEAERHALRGSAMALVVQSPRTALDPLSRVGAQLVRVQQAHRRVSRAEATAKALALLRAVGIPAPEQRMRAWPHELSGGMAQRVLIALALANEPALILADEPTTGLDVTVQTQILDLLRGLARDRGTGLMIITHDLGVVAQYCDRVAVMFAGSIVETGPVGRVLVAPRHPYAQALVAATPERIAQGGHVVQSGPPPDLFALPEGCVYADRCALASAACRRTPPAVDLGSGHVAHCHHVPPARPALKVLP